MRRCLARIDRPEIEAFVVPGGNFPTMASIEAWERGIGKPVVITNQAALGACLKRLGSARPHAGARAAAGVMPLKAPAR